MTKTAFKMLLSGFMALIAVRVNVAFSAQMATVEADNAPLLQGPRKDAAVLGQLKKGIRLDVSNYPTQGYYKVRTPKKEIGWVSVDALELLSPASGATGSPSGHQSN